MVESGDIICQIPTLCCKRPYKLMSVSCGVYTKIRVGVYHVNIIRLGKYCQPRNQLPYSSFS